MNGPETNSVFVCQRVADLQAERGRLQEVNRGLMLQQQRQAAQAAQTPRAPSKSRALNTPAPPGFQLASAVYAPPRPPPPASTASQSATPYPQLPVAWWNKAGASTQFDAVSLVSDDSEVFFQEMYVLDTKKLRLVDPWQKVELVQRLDNPYNVSNIGCKIPLP